jgi:hypothetical protein
MKHGLLILVFYPLWGLNVLAADPQVVNLDSGEMSSRAGERIDFLVQWTGITVGEIALRDFGPVKFRDRACHKVLAYAKTTGAVEKLYKARRQYIGYLMQNHTSWLYEEWEKDEGNWRMEEWLGFFPEEGLVRRYKKDKLRNEMAVTAGTLDPVGAGNHLRNLPLRPGDHYEVTVTQGKYEYLATADVIRGGTMETILGSVATLLVIPKIYWKGEPLGKRTMKVWFTDDDRRIPVKLFADIEFGSFTAELDRYQPPTGRSEPTRRG